MTSIWKYRKVVICLVLMIHAIQTSAQNIELDLKKVFTAYNESDHFKMTLSNKIYFDGKLHESINQEIVRCGDSYEIRMGDIEIRNDTNYLILLDHEDKTLIISNPKPYNIADFSVALVDSLLKHALSTKYTILSTSQHQYAIQITAKSSMKIVYNPNSNKLLRIIKESEEEMELNEKIVKNQRVETTVQSFKILPQSSKIGENKYLMLNGNVVSLSPEYKGFQVMNYYIPKKP